jgi:hypothetical protein
MYQVVTRRIPQIALTYQTSTNFNVTNLVANDLQNRTIKFTRFNVRIPPLGPYPYECPTSVVGGIYDVTTAAFVPLTRPIPLSQTNSVYFRVQVPGELMRWMKTSAPDNILGFFVYNEAQIGTPPGVNFIIESWYLIAEDLPTFV